MKKLYTLIAAVAVLASCAPKKEQAKADKYPETKKIDQIDTISTVVVNDPYRWLENDTAKDVAEWVSKENDVTFGYLKNIPFRDAIRKRLDELQNYERLSAPSKFGEYYYYS